MAKRQKAATTDTQVTSTTTHPQEKSIEETYKHYSDYEYILKRPELYVGECSVDTDHPRWVWSPQGRMQCRMCTYSPALFNVCDEILANARDNRYRRPECPMTWVSVEVRRRAPHNPSIGPWIRIRNNGRGIENVIHQDYGWYVPEMVFGMLRSSSNYDDTEGRITGGRNGIGAKVANIFSHLFFVETSDYKNGEKGTVYRQTWTQNMKNKTDAKITKKKATKTPSDWTDIQFVPDVVRLGYPAVEEENVGLQDKDCPSGSSVFEAQFDTFLQWMARRTIDIAGVCPGVRTYFNGTQFQFRSFHQYASLYDFPGVVSTSSGAGSTPPDEKKEEKGNSGTKEEKGALGALPPLVKKSPQKDEQQQHVAPISLEESMSSTNANIPKENIQNESKPEEHQHTNETEVKTEPAPDGTALRQKEENRKDADETIAPIDKEWQKKHGQVLYEWFRGEHSPQDSTSDASVSWDIVVGALPYEYTLSPQGSPSSPEIQSSPHASDPRCLLKGCKDVSFVNGIETTQGGTHVSLVRTQKIGPSLMNELPKDLRASLTDRKLGKCLYFFINAVVVNPRFETQTKEKLTTPPSHFNYLSSSSSSSARDIPFSPDRMKSKAKACIAKVDVSTKVRKAVEKTLQTEEKQASGRKKSMVRHPKLQDAQNAGRGAKAFECTLFLTEGDSAAAFARSGIDLLGTAYYGIFPLVGKVNNVRADNIQPKHVPKHEVINSIVEILGLDFSRRYDTLEARRSLRYGRVLIMCDQDADGSHIKGLILNFFNWFWPSLFKPVTNSSSSYFLYQFITPYVKAKKKKKKQPRTRQKSLLSTNDGIDENKKEDEDEDEDEHQDDQDNEKNEDTIESMHASRDELWFYSEPEYEEWRSARVTEGTMEQYAVKYYKGLGTSSDEEAREYFEHYNDYIIPFLYHGQSSDDALSMVFGKLNASKRREWLQRYVPGTYMTYHRAGMSIDSFVDTELVLFSWYDNERSIPSLVDGLKPSQRKILYGAVQKGLGTAKSKELKVAQLSHMVAQATAYHHGEKSLNGTIISMAQEFVGSNNVPLFVPDGQFGTRHKGGEDKSDARYVFTYFQSYARTLFPSRDDSLVPREYEEDTPIEPKYYVPIIPTLLCNGCNGLGTGYRSDVPSFSPLQLIDLLLDRLGKNPNVTSTSTRLLEFTPSDFESVCPWYAGFQGTIVPKNVPRSKSSENLNTDNSPDYSLTLSSIYPTFLVRGKLTIEQDSHVEILPKKDANEGADMVVRIDELPVKKWSDKYEEDVIDKAWGKYVAFVEKLHSKKRVQFRVGLNQEGASYVRSLQEEKHKKSDYESDPLLRAFRLEDEITYSLCYAFTPDGKMCKYSGPHDLFNAFTPVRLQLYETRRQAIIDDIADTCDRLRNIIAFLDDVIHHRLELRGQKKAELVESLRNRGYQVRRPAQYKNAASSETARAHDFDYLLQHNLWTLTQEIMQEKRDEYARMQVKYDEMVHRTTAVDLWCKELREVREAFVHYFSQREADTQGTKNKKPCRSSPSKPKKRKNPHTTKNSSTKARK
jgi:DNA topoisomerase-2